MKIEGNDAFFRDHLSFYLKTEYHKLYICGTAEKYLCILSLSIGKTLIEKVVRIFTNFAGQKTLIDCSMMLKVVT